MGRIYNMLRRIMVSVLVTTNIFLLIVDFMILGVLFWIFAASLTKQVVVIYALYYGLLMYGSHYYTGRLALKMFAKYKPDESKPGLINYWYAKILHSGRRVSI